MFEELLKIQDAKFAEVASVYSAEGEKLRSEWRENAKVMSLGKAHDIYAAKIKILDASLDKALSLITDIIVELRREASKEGGC